MQVPAGDSDSEDEDSDDIDEQKGSAVPDASSPGNKQGGLGGWSKNVKNLGKTLAKVKAVAAFMSMDDENSRGARKLVKKRRLWQLYIEEGPGVVTSSKYRPDLEPLAPGSGGEQVGNHQ